MYSRGSAIHGKALEYTGREEGFKGETVGCRGGSMEHIVGAVSFRVGTVSLG